MFSVPYSFIVVSMAHNIDHNECSRPVAGEMFGHSQSRSYCFQVQSVYMLTYCLVFFSINLGAYSIDSSKMMDNFQKVFELAPVVSQTQPGSCVTSIWSSPLLHCSRLWTNAQDRSLQCPSNAISPIKIYLSQNNPSKRNPILNMKTSLEVLNTICPPREPNKRRALSLQEVELQRLTLHSSHCTRNMYHIIHAQV